MNVLEFALRAFIFYSGCAALSFGWYELSFAFNYPSPVKTTCSDFIANPSKHKWVSVEDCVIDFALSQKIDKSEMGALVFSSHQIEAEDDAVKTAVVVKVSDPQRIMTASTNWKIHFQASEELNETRYQLINEPLVDSKRAQFIAHEKELSKTLRESHEKLLVSEAMILKFLYDQPRYTLPKTHLAHDYFVYGYSSADDKASYFKGILSILCGMFLTAGVIYTFYSDRRYRRPP